MADNSIASVYVSVLAETSRLAPKIRDSFRSVDNDAREAGRRWGREIEQGVGTVNVKVDADTARAKAEIETLSRDQRVELKVDVDRSSVGSFGSMAVPQFAKAGSAAGDAFSSGLMSTMKSPALAAVAVGVIGTALIDVGGIAASAAQSMAVLPGVIGAAAVAMGTLKLATAGFSDAVEAIGDQDKFATALQALSPAAQQAALSIQALMPAFDALKFATQDAFFAGVGGMLNGLANTYLPTIQQATTGIATAFNTMFAGVANQLMTPGTQQAIQGFLANVTQAFQNLAPAAAPLTQALSTLMNAGSSVLPAIAQAATQAAFAFSDFIQKASQSGALQRFLGEGLDTLKQLGQIAWDVGRAFLAMAPAGQQILPKIVTGVQFMADVMPNIVSGVQAVQSALGTLAPVLAPTIAMVDLFRNGMGAIATVAQGVAQALTNAFTAVTQVIDRALQPIREAINLANMLPGVSIPQIGSVSGKGGEQIINPSVASALAPGTFRRRDGSVGQTAPQVPALPAAALPSIPTGGYSVPLPPPATGGSTAGTAFKAGDVSGVVVTPENVMRTLGLAQEASGKPYGYGGVGPGSMSQDGPGLYDCSGFMSDLYASLTGKPLAAGERYFTTESDFSKLGFVEGYDPNSVFNIGVHNGGGGKSSHMAGTLNGVSVESGGNGTLYGGKAKGALDPEFEKQYHLPSSMYSGLSMAAGSSKSSPMYVMPADEKAFGGGDVKQLGSDFMSGIMQIFGIDGSLFANPLDSGLWKGVTGVANFAGALGQAQSGSMVPGGGGGGGLGGLLGLAQGFMPGMPGSNSMNIVDAAQFKPPGGPGSPGPGNVVDNSLNITGPVGLDPGGFVQDLNALRTSQSRWAPLAQNLPQ